MGTVIDHYKGILNALGGVVPDDEDKLLTTYLQAIQEAIEAGGGGGGTPQVQSDWTETDTTKKSFIKNKPTLLTRVRLTADDTHIYKDGTALTYTEVEALVMNSNLLVTLVYNGEVSFLPSATDGSAIWFDGAFIVSDVVNHMRVIIDNTDAVKVTQLELARLDEVLKNYHKLVELGMLGWNVPDDCPIQNQISGKQFIQKVGRVDIGTFYWMYRASDGFMTTNYQVPSKTIAETDKPNAYCDIYRALPRSGAVSINNVDKSFAVPNKYIVIHDSTYTDARTFMDAVKGVYVYYELETPIVKKIDGNEALITKEILESQKLNKISMEGEFNIWTDGDNAKIDYEDNYITMEGDFITIHNNAGNASKISMNDGDIKLEGCPDAGTTKNAMIQLGTNDGVKSYVNIEADEVTINGKSQALYQHKITVSGDDVDSDGYWFYFPPFYSTDATELAVNDVEQTSSESERKHLQEVLDKLPSCACGIDGDELHWCGVSFYNGVFIASKAEEIGGSFFVGQAKEIWSLSNWSVLSDISVRDVVTKIL